MDKQSATNERHIVDLLNQETKELQDNSKQIEDMAKIIHKHFQYIKGDWEEYTKSDLALVYALKWNGYQKIQADSVVLTRDGYDTLIAVENERIKQARKETAEKIMNDISGDVLVVDTKEYGRIEVVPLERLDEICKEFTEVV